MENGYSLFETNNYGTNAMDGGNIHDPSVDLVENQKVPELPGTELKERRTKKS